MTKQDLIKIIREVVRKEVKSILKEERKPKQKNKMSLTEAIMETKNISNINNEWPEISQQEIRNKFTGMQSEQQRDINNRPVNIEKLDPTLNKALNRDYSELVKRFNK